MLIKSLKSGNHYQFITLFVVCATGRSCLLFNNNIVPFDNKDSAKKKHRQIYRFIKVLCDRAEVPAVRGGIHSTIKRFFAIPFLYIVS